MDFCLLPRVWIKSIDINKSKHLSGKYCQKLLDHAKQYATDAFEAASKNQFKKTANTTGDLIGSRITKVSKNSLQNNSVKVINEHEKEIPKERYIFP